LVSFGPCVVCSSSIYRFWLPLWYLLIIVLFVLLQYTDSNYTFGILYWRRTNNTMTKRYQRCNQNQYIEEEQTTQWPKDTKGVIRISILKKNKQHNDQKIPSCLFFFNILILITSLVSFGHCVVCSSSIYWFWLLLWYLLIIVLFVLLQYTDSDYFFGIFSVYWRRTDNTMTKRYQRSNQNQYIEEEQTTQWPKDTKGVIILL
jgi:preprotein translocase subunit SecG